MLHTFCSLFSASESDLWGLLSVDCSGCTKTFEVHVPTVAWDRQTNQLQLTEWKYTHIESPMSLRKVEMTVYLHLAWSAGCLKSFTFPMLQSWIQMETALEASA